MFYIPLSHFITYPSFSSPQLRPVLNTVHRHQRTAPRHLHIVSFDDLLVFIYITLMIVQFCRRFLIILFLSKLCDRFFWFGDVQLSRVFNLIF